MPSIEKAGLDPAQIKYIVLSHGHPGQTDHTGGANYLQRTYGARVAMGRPDWDATLPAQKPERPLAKRDIDIIDGTTLTLGDTTLSFALEPGHSPGSLAMFISVRWHGESHMVMLLAGALQTPDRAAFDALAHIMNDIAKPQNVGGPLERTSWDLPGHAHGYGNDPQPSRRAQPLAVRAGARQPLLVDDRRVRPCTYRRLGGSCRRARPIASPIEVCMKPVRLQLNPGPAPCPSRCPTRRPARSPMRLPAHRPLCVGSRRFRDGKLRCRSPPTANAGRKRHLWRQRTCRPVPPAGPPAGLRRGVQDGVVLSVNGGAAHVQFNDLETDVLRAQLQGNDVSVRCGDAEGTATWPANRGDLTLFLAGAEAPDVCTISAGGQELVRVALAPIR